MIKEELARACDEPDHVLVLVHGTFARSVAWTRPDSKMATTVKSAIPGNVLVTSFEWSGRNSHGARLSGGAELARRLRLLRDSHPSASLHVVAHSHGGNVVAYALREASVRDSLCGVICLGTPFVVPRPRSLKPTLRLLKIGGATISIVALLLLAFVAWSVIAFALYVPDTSTVLFGIVFLLLGGVVCHLAARLGVRVGRYMENRMAPRLKAMQDDIIALLQVTFEDVPVLNIQTRRDEAAGYLRLIERIANLPFRVWSPTAMARAIVMVTVLFVPSYSYVMLQSEDWRQGPVEAIGGLIFGFAIYLLVVIAVVLLSTTIAQAVCVLWAKIFRGHALGFGEEGFRQNWLVAISASSQPPGAERARNEIVDVKGGGLHHSLLHEDHAVLRSIASWLGAHADRDKALFNEGMQPTQ